MPSLDLERLRGRRLFVGTPMYDGQCCSDFAFSIARLAALCTRFGVELQFFFACREALVTKARNITVDEFLRSGDDNLIFIDADIGFDARDVLHLLALQSLDPNATVFDVVAAPYPTKRMAWDTVRSAAKAGLADQDAEQLARYSSTVLISPAHDTSFAIHNPVEVTQAGTGFMMIRRETFERYRKRYPQRKYRSENVGLEHNASPEIFAFFDTEIDSKHENIASEIKAFLADFPTATHADLLAFIESDAAFGSYNGKYISEDYAFCRRVRAAGMRIWFCPWMELSHMGSHRFTSRLADLGAIGAL